MPMNSLGAAEENGAAAQSPAGYFQFIQTLFDRAVEQAGVSHHFFKVGGQDIQLSFAGPSLIPKFIPALEHLRSVPTQPPSFTVSLWDCMSTGVSMPPPPWKHAQILARGDVEGFNDAEILTVFQLGTNALHMVDRSKNRAIYWVRNAGQVPVSDSAHPLRIILNQWAERQNLMILHAGAVGTRHGGVLLAGKSGSGKSTAALSCLDSKLRLAAEDTVLLSMGPAARVYSLYSSAKLTRASLELLPELQPMVCNPQKIDSEKGLIFLHPNREKNLIDSFPLKAILLPMVSPQREAGFEKASPADGLKALAPSSIFQVPGSGPTEFFGMGALVKKLPTYQFFLGKDVKRIPEAISDLLSTLD